METVQATRHDPGELHPHGLNFLQKIYGPDDRLEALQPQHAHQLADELLALYCARLNEEAAADKAPGMPGRDRARLSSAIHYYLDGVASDDIAHVLSYPDDVTVDIERQDVVAGLRRWSALTGTAEPRRRLGLDELLYRHRTPGPWRPIGGIGNLAVGRDYQPVRETAGLQLWRDHLTQESAAALTELSCAPGFIKAAGRQERHDRPAEVFAVLPGATSARACWLREAHWRQTAAIFGPKDGDTYQNLRADFDPQRDTAVLTVKHHGEQAPEPASALHFRIQGDGPLVPALEAIESEWGQPIGQTVKESSWPISDTMAAYLSSDFKGYRRLMEIITVAVGDKFRGTAAALAMYNVSSTFGERNGVTDYVAALDRSAGEMLSKYEGGFQLLDTLPYITYHSIFPKSNTTGLYHCNGARWRAALQGTKSSASYRLFWDEKNALRREYALTYVTD